MELNKSAGLVHDNARFGNDCRNGDPRHRREGRERAKLSGPKACGVAKHDQTSARETNGYRHRGGEDGDK